MANSWLRFQALVAFSLCWPFAARDVGGQQVLRIRPSRHLQEDAEYHVSANVH